MQAKACYKRIRSYLEFDRLYDASVQIAEQQGISKPELPRPRRRPARLEEAEPHQYQNARAYYRHIYFEACDLLCGELESRFECQHMPSVLAMEQTLLKAANGEDYSSKITLLKGSCYENDIQWSDLSRHLSLFQDVIKKATPSVKEVTSIHTICDAMNSNSVYKRISLRYIVYFVFT